MPTKKSPSADTKVAPPSSPTPPASKTLGKKQKPLTPRQANFVKLMPQIATGKLTVEAALKKSGYSKNSARQQTNTTKGIRQNTVMQDALRNAGFTEEFIAREIVGDLKKLRAGRPRLGYIEAGSRLLDVEPSKKTDLTLVGLEDALDNVEKDAEYAAWDVPGAK